MDAAKKALLNMLIEAFTSFDKFVNNASKMLSGDKSMMDVDKIWIQVLKLSSYLKPFCYTIIGICLLIEMVNVLSKVDVIKWEQGIKVSIKIVLAKVMIDGAPTFLLACYKQATSWINLIHTANVAIGVTMKSSLETKVNDIKGLWSVIMLIISINLLIFAIKVCGMFVQVIAFGRMFELFVYLCISPLPFAFFPLGDGNGGGYSRITKKFILSFVGVCLHGVMIIICIKLFNIIMFSIITKMNTSGADATTSVSNVCFAMLLGGVVLAMSCAKAGSWAKSVLDAG